MDNTDQKAEADLVNAHQKRELKVEEGISYITCWVELFKNLLCNHISNKDIVL